MNDIALQVRDVSKDFILPHEKKDSIKRAVTGLLKPVKKGSSVHHALQEVSFEVKKGEFFGVVGRNGSGKSTLLKILAGIYQPTHGSVTRQGRLVPFIELGVGFNGELSGRENIFLNGAMLGFSRTEIESLYDEIVAFAELEEFMGQKLKNYSSGMQVRLAFSLAVQAKADILLVDEVLAVGDAAFQRKCFDYFKELKRNKQTVVFVSHDMGAVQQYCDRAMLIDNSKIVEIGKAREIAMRYNQLFFTPVEREHEVLGRAKKPRSPSGEERWGDGQAKWDKVTARVLPGAKGQESETVEITAKGRALQAITFPIFGFSIKNADFLQLAGTNTLRKQMTIPPLAKGETFSITWKVPNVFNAGLHYVDCTIAHDQATMVSDRWPDAASFTMQRLEATQYPIYSAAECVYNQKS